MVDEAITATDVLAAAGATVKTVTGGEVITAGMSVYLDTSDNTWKKAIANGTALQAGSAGIGIALNDCNIDGGPLEIIQAGNVDPGFTPTVGMRYYVGNDAAGGIMAAADLLSSDYVTLLGVGTSASNLLVRPWVTGQQVP